MIGSRLSRIRSEGALARQTDRRPEFRVTAPAGRQFRHAGIEERQAEAVVGAFSRWNPFRTDISILIWATGLRTAVLIASLGWLVIYTNDLVQE